MDYGADVVKSYLYSELQALGMVEKQDGVYIHPGTRKDYIIELHVFPIEKDKQTVRIQEPYFDPPYLVD